MFLRAGLHAGRDTTRVLDPLRHPGATRLKRPVAPTMGGAACRWCRRGAWPKESYPLSFPSLKYT